jgi:hypothetical protein
MIEHNANDDGSLNFLNIPANPTQKRYNCDETSQEKLINLTFWVIGFFDGIDTKFGKNRYLVKIKMNREDEESKARKFFTNSPEIKYVLNEIKKLDAFPRKVTLRAKGNNYWFE